MTRLLAGQPPIITGDGEQTRDFTYIDNVVDGVLRAAVAPDVARTSHQRRHRPSDLHQPAPADVQQLLGSDVAAVHTEARAGDVRDSLADISPCHGSCWATSRTCHSKKACAAPSSGTRRRGRLGWRNASVTAVALPSLGTFTCLAPAVDRPPTTTDGPRHRPIDFFPLTPVPPTSSTNANAPTLAGPRLAERPSRSHADQREPDLLSTSA